MAIVQFTYADVPSVSLKNKKEVKLFIEEIFSTEGKGIERLDYIFCSDEFLLQINQDFLKHDDYTDIITFNLTPQVFVPIVGEIYISVDRVRENAGIHHTSFSGEIKRVIFHGALHLCGYNDKTKREITIMRQKEDHYLRLFDKRK